MTNPAIAAATLLIRCLKRNRLARKRRTLLLSN